MARRGAAPRRHLRLQVENTPPSVRDHMMAKTLDRLHVLSWLRSKGFREHHVPAHVESFLQCHAPEANNVRSRTVRK